MRIIYETEDGGVAVIIPAPGVSLEDASRDVPDGAPWRVVDAADIPADRSERVAWVMPAEGGPVVDLAARKAGLLLFWEGDAEMEAAIAAATTAADLAVAIRGA